MVRCCIVLDLNLTRTPYLSRSNPSIPSGWPSLHKAAPNRPSARHTVYGWFPSPFRLQDFENKALTPRSRPQQTESFSPDLQLLSPAAPSCFWITMEFFLPVATRAPRSVTDRRPVQCRGLLPATPQTRSIDRIPAPFPFRYTSNASQSSVPDTDRG